MPTYSYFCEERHETEWFGSYDSRPDTVGCKECGNESRRGFAISAHQKGSEFTPLPRSSKSIGLSIHDFRCGKCSRVFEGLVDHNAGESVSSVPCPKCGEVATWIPAARIERFSEIFPYYDRGAGRVFNSKEERREWIRQTGCTPVDGDFDMDAYFAEIDRKDEEDHKIWVDYIDRVENAPEFVDYRKARDQGRLP